MSAVLLDPTTVPAYLASRDDLAGLIDPTSVTVTEVGDGNLNLVFIATDADSRSLVLKQSLPYVRMVGESWPLSQDRILAEARGYDAAARLAPEFIPAYHGLDHDRRLIVVEDLSSWTVWRRALNEGLIAEGAGAALGTYVARVAFGTSVLGIQPEEYQAALAAAANPELCRITEDLIFTEPFIDHDHNEWDPELTDDVLALRNRKLLAEVAVLKYRFETSGQSLIHGDLHTGSVFVPGLDAPPGTPAAKAFDIEFAFYGPTGFDLGALFGNYLAARARASQLRRPTDFVDWLDTLVAETWQGFEQEFRRLWPGRVDPAFTDAFLERWLARTWSDAVGFGGLKAIRRIVGLAKVSDIETLPQPQRVAAARLVLQTASTWVLKRDRIASPAELPWIDQRADS